MSISSRSQKIAVAAFDCVNQRAGTESGKAANRKKYLSFARAFPTLIHTSGLAQASAFAMAKGVKDAEKREVLDDLASVMTQAFGIANSNNGSQLNTTVRHATVLTNYLQLSRQALQCASWIKRYAEALLVDSPTSSNSETENSNSMATHNSETI